VLGKARVNIHNKVLYKAFMMPEESTSGFKEGRSYPTPAYGLMERPKEDKKKKKKKGRRRRRASSSIEKESQDEQL
jgi:hypothetical protein